MHIDPFSLSGKTMVLLLAVVCGGLIGLNRELHGQAAGMRTHILVCVGATLITMTSVEIGLGLSSGGRLGDPGHIAAQIVSGVGFLGAGAIIREGMSVRGLTTAASIWTTAGIGITLGASPRLGELAVVATLIVLGTLIVLNWVEDAFKLKRRIRDLDVEVEEAEHGAARVLALLAENRIVINDVQFEAGQITTQHNPAVPTRRMHLQVQLPVNFDRDRFQQLLTEMPGVHSYALE
jgi:putative Mg2+ transporter-C (MgtC) family protein